jgi:hypothetical protein
MKTIRIFSILFLWALKLSAQCTHHDVIHLVPAADASVNWNGNSHTYFPGDTLEFDSSYTYGTTNLSNIYGTPGCPVILTNKGTTWDSSSKVSTNTFTCTTCQYVTMTGQNHDTLNYNWHFDGRQLSVGAGRGGGGVSFTGDSKCDTLSYLDIENKDEAIIIKQEIACGDSLQWHNFVMDSFYVGYNKIRGTIAEGMYIGSTDPDNVPTGATRPYYVVCIPGDTTYPKPLRMGDFIIVHNNVDSTGRSGIQLSSSEFGFNRIDSNTISRCGYEFNPSGQGCGISLGSYDDSNEVYYNHIQRTFTTGIQAFPGGWTDIQHNYIDSSGILDGHNSNTPIYGNVQQASVFIDRRSMLFPSPQTPPLIKTDTPYYIHFTVSNNFLGYNVWNNFVAYNSPNTMSGYTLNNLFCTNTKIGSGSITSSINGAISIASCSGLLTPPVLTPAAGATVDGSFIVTFPDNTTWRTNFTNLSVGGTILSTAAYSVTAGQITFTPSASVLLQSSGSKSIVIVASGFSNDNLTQPIAAGVATALHIQTQPTTVPYNGAALGTQPVIYLLDQYGNHSVSTPNVTAAVYTGTWTLGGTTTIAAVSGTATYTNLTGTSAADVPAATILFTSPTLTSAQSATFDVPGPGTAIPTIDPISSAIIKFPVTTVSNITATAHTSSGTITGYSWTQIGGLPVTILNGSTQAASFTGLHIAEPYTFKVTATNSYGNTVSTNFVIFVKNSCTP